MTELEKQDLEVVARFDREFKELCVKHGVYVTTTTQGKSHCYVLTGSSKPGINSNIYLVYSGRL